MSDETCAGCGCPAAMTMGLSGGYCWSCQPARNHKEREEKREATQRDELRALVDEAREQGRAEERARAATIRIDALAEGESRGRDVERGRVLRLLNVAFTGKALDTDLSAAIVKLCQDVARGKDVTS